MATLFRARIMDNSEEREQAREVPADRLGPPPKRSRRAGRTNAAGVGAFYGALDAPTCIAELRPAAAVLRPCPMTSSAARPFGTREHATIA